MDVVRRDLKRGEYIKNLFLEWKENTFDVEGGADSGKYLIGEISIAFNVDFSEFMILDLESGVTWDMFREQLLNYIKQNKQINPEKLAERTSLALLDIASNDLIIAGIEYVIVDQMKKRLFNRKFQIRGCIFLT